MISGFGDRGVRLVNMYHPFSCKILISLIPLFTLSSALAERNESESARIEEQSMLQNFHLPWITFFDDSHWTFKATWGDNSLPFRNCYIAAAMASLSLSDITQEYREEYGYDDVMIEVPELEVHGLPIKVPPLITSAVFTIYHILQEMAKSKSPYKEGDFVTKRRHYVITKASFKNREDDLPKNNVLRKRHNNPVLSPRQNSDGFTPSKPRDIDQRRSAVNIPSDFQPIWSHRWLPSSRQIQDQNFYMALITLACSASARQAYGPGVDDPIIDFSTYEAPYKVGVVDESHPPGIINMDLTWVIKMGAKAAELAAQEQQIPGLLELTLQWKDELGREVADWKLYYPGLDPDGPASNSPLVL